jgi:hypothetical protein
MPPVESIRASTAEPIPLSKAEAATMPASKSNAA